MAFGVRFRRVEVRIADRQRRVERGQRAVVPFGARLGIPADQPRPKANLGEGQVVDGFGFHAPHCTTRLHDFVLYHVVERGNPSNPAAPRKFYPSIEFEKA